jgi:hypothetical protein
VPLQVPLSAVSVEPACAVPEIVGRAVLAGAASLAARPLPGTPKTAPIASAAAASMIVVTHRRRRELTPVIS